MTNSVVPLCLPTRVGSYGWVVVFLAAVFMTVFRIAIKPNSGNNTTRAFLLYIYIYIHCQTSLYGSPGGGGPLSWGGGS